MTEHIYLAHHGIKGMKWGVRRFRNEDGSLTSAGRERYGVLSRREKKIAKYENQYQKKGFDEETARSEAEAKYERRRKALIIGGTVVAAYATYKFVDSGKAHQMVLEGKSIVNKMIGSDTAKFKQNDALSSASGVDEIMSKVVSRINPEYGQLGTTNNCRRCTFAYEMSRRGYDVRATKSISGTGQSGFGFGKAINNPFSIGNYLKKVAEDNTTVDDINRILEKTGVPTRKSSDPFKLLTDFPNGSRGEVSVMWDVGGMHSMAWEIVSGKPVIFDCQTGNKYFSVDDLGYLAEHAEKFAVNRLDNVELDMRFLERWLTNA